MAKRGRKPKPTIIKEMEGNPGKRPLNRNEPKPQKDKSLTPPKWLGAEAKKEWRRVVPELDRLGLYTMLDKAILEGYCRAYAKWKEAEQFIMEHGVSYKIPKKDADGKVVSIYVAQWPEVAIAKQSLDQVRAFCSEFGMSPSSRSRMSLPGDKDDDREFEDLLD